MKEKKIYDPEDLNKLLRNKSFDQLLSEEKDFVKEHIDSSAEYAKLRNLLLNIEDQAWDETPDPNPRVKEFLVRKHASTKKKTMKVWLNGFFGFGASNVSWYQKPAFQVGLASCIVLFTVISISQFNKQEVSIVENNVPVEEHASNQSTQKLDGKRMDDSKSEAKEGATEESLIKEIMDDTEAESSDSNIQNTLKDKSELSNVEVSATSDAGNATTTNTWTANDASGNSTADRLTATDDIRINEPIAAPNIEILDMEPMADEVMEVEEANANYKFTIAQESTEFEDAASGKSLFREQDGAISSKEIISAESSSNERKKESEDKLSAVDAMPSSISLAQQERILDQLFEAY